MKTNKPKSKVSLKKKFKDVHEDSYKTQARPRPRQNTAIMNMSVITDHNNSMNNTDKLSVFSVSSKISNKDL
jgi:hypothetical protein